MESQCTIKKIYEGMFVIMPITQLVVVLTVLKDKLGTCCDGWDREVTIDQHVRLRPGPHPGHGAFCMERRRLRLSNGMAWPFRGSDIVFVGNIHGHCHVFNRVSELSIPGMDEEAIFFTGRGGAGKGKAKNLWGGAGQESPPSPQCWAWQGGAGAGNILRVTAN